MDLGLGPVSDLQQATNETVNLTNDPSERSSEALTRVRQLNLLIPVLSETNARAIELNQLTGEGSERGNEDRKLCDGVSQEKKADVDKTSGCDLNYFDCNICLDLSKEPVVTSCGHLYCWPCLYQWLQFSDAKECPVCKGEATPETVTPIYGCGKHKRETEETKKIPIRPHARRIKSLRKTTQRPPLRVLIENTIQTTSEILNNVSSILDLVRSAQNQLSPAAAAMLAASRRRNENGSSVSYVDSADSRPPRRRRFT